MNRYLNFLAIVIGATSTATAADDLPAICREKIKGRFTLLKPGQKAPVRFTKKGAPVRVFCVGGFGGGLWRGAISTDCNWSKLRRGGLTAPKMIAEKIKNDLYRQALDKDSPIVLKAHSMGAATTLEMMKLIHDDLKSSKKRTKMKAKKLLTALQGGGIELHQSAAKGTPHLTKGFGKALAWGSQKTGIVKGIGAMQPAVAKKRMKEQGDFCQYLKDGKGKDIRHVVISTYATQEDLKVFNGKKGKFNRGAQKLFSGIMGKGTDGCDDGYVNVIDTTLRCTKEAYLIPNKAHFLPDINSTGTPIGGVKDDKDGFR